MRTAFFAASIAPAVVVAYFPPYHQPNSHAFSLQTLLGGGACLGGLSSSSLQQQLLIPGLGAFGSSRDCSTNPLHAFNAADHSLNLLGGTRTTCPPFIMKTGQCPEVHDTFAPVSFNTSIPLPSSDAPETGPGAVFMDATVPFGQQLYVGSNGLLQYTRALAPHPPPDAYTELFTLHTSFVESASVQLLFNHTAFYACRGNDNVGTPDKAAVHGATASGDGLRRRAHALEKRRNDMSVERIYAVTPGSRLDGCREVQAFVKNVESSGEVFEYI